MTHRKINTSPLYRRFISDRRGVTAILFAILLIPLLAMIGGAIDFSRAFIVKTRLQSSLDAAILATAAAAGLTDAERIAYGESIFQANYPASELGTVAQAVITITADGRVTGSVSADLSTTFLNVIGIGNLTINSTNEAKIASLINGEIVLVLDYSGSMNSGGKYQAMRDASVTLIYSLSQNGGNVNIRFGLVPFSKHVYGTIESDYIVNEVPGGMWTNCTMDRKWPYNIEDSTPVTANDDTKWGMTCVAGDDDEVDDDDDDDDEEEACSPYADCFNYTSRNLIMSPLTSNHAATISQLQSMTPYSYTHISLGLAFGWHLIAPNSPWQEGVAYNTDNVLKAIILLTDGRQTAEGWGPGNSSSVSNAETNLEEMCQAIKDAGVLLVTVAFDLDDIATENRLRNCATSPAFFFEANSNASLAAAFEAIAAQIAKLTLTK